MATAATWTTTEIPAYLLAVGDYVRIDGHSDGTVTAIDNDGATTTVSLDGQPIGIRWSREQVGVHVPDVPVDGYDLFKPQPGWSPLGCTCLSRRHPDLPGNWDLVTTDPDCYSHGVHDDWED